MTIVYGGYRASLKVRRSAQLSKNLPFMDMGPYNPQPTIFYVPLYLVAHVNFLLNEYDDDDDDDDNSNNGCQSI